MQRDPSPREVRRVSAQEGYDLWADHYDLTSNPVVAMDRRYSLSVLDAVRGERVLDAGCGTGSHLESLLEAGAAAVGIDFSAGMLRVAHERLPDAALFAADLQQTLPFADAAFDAALCALVGEHLANIRDVLAELYRVLRPGGRLVFSVYHPDMAAAGIEANFARDGVEYRLGAHPYTVRDYLEAIIQAGFEGFAYREYACDEALVAEIASASKYAGRPMLLIIAACAGE